MERLSYYFLHVGIGMKKLFFILIALNILFAGCTTKDEYMLDNSVPETELSDDEETAGYVRINLGISMPELKPQTKTLGADPTDLRTIHVAIFGRSGYLKEYVQAEPVGGTAVTNGTKEDTEHDRYQFTVLLPISENSERHIHIIGNGPKHLDYGQETDLLPSLLSPRDSGSYWQSFIIPGIKAQRDPETGKFLKDGEPQDTGTGVFDVHPQTAAYFENIALIRNYSQIVIEESHPTQEHPEIEECNFRTISFAAVNIAREGAVVPYFSNGFVYGYENKDYQDLLDMGYPALLPMNAVIDDYIPSASAYEHAADSARVSAAGEPFFMYERPIPNDQQAPTVVIIYGTYTSPDPPYTSTNCYYKVDLMEYSQYYPIFRNFRYRINIKKILKPGASTPEGAMYSMGSGDISSDISTQTLTDISDGTSRILVTYMNKTLIRQYEYDDEDEELTLFYKYIPNISVMAQGGQEPQWNNTLAEDGGPVSIALQSGLGSDAVITNYKVSDADENGWRRITFETSEPSANMRSQYIQITGTPTGDRPPLFRRVTFTMINTQTMNVACVPHKVEHNIGEDLAVNITIPKNLPSGMFPLKFHLESSKLSITPDNSKSNNNLPVGSGTSLVPNSNDVAFYYIRTLSEKEYTALSKETTGNTVTIPCYFKTNMAQSASTVYVKDEGGYFYPANDNFTNFGMKSFFNKTFVSGVPTTNATAAYFTFEMDNSDDLPDIVYLRFTGAAPAYGSGLIKITDPEDPYHNWYWYSPSQTNNNDLKEGNGYRPRIHYATVAGTGEVKIEIQADEYENADHEHKLTAFSVSPTSSSVRGKGRTISTTSTLTYNNDPTTVTLPLASGTPAATISWTSDDESIATVNSNGVITTTGYGSTTIHAQIGSFSVSIPITVNKPRFSNVGFYSNTNGTTASSLALGLKEVYFHYDYETGYSGSGYPVTFTLTGLEPASDETKLVSNGDGTYTYTPAANDIETSKYFHLKSTLRFTSCSVQIASDEYDTVDVNGNSLNKSISRPTTLTLPSGTSLVAGTRRPYYNYTYAYAYYTDNYTNTYRVSSNGYQTRFNTSDPYASRDNIIIDLTKYGNDVEDGVVYFQYYSYEEGQINYANHYAQAPLADIIDTLDAGNKYTLNFKIWTTTNVTFTVSSNNYQWPGVVWTVSDNPLISMYFTNNSGINNNNNYYVQIGTTSAAGTIYITTEGSVYDGIKLTGATITYRSTSYDDRSVTVSVGSISNNRKTWTASNSGDGKGDDAVTITMASGNTPNQISSVQINFGYWD